MKKTAFNYYLASLMTLIKEFNCFNLVSVFFNQSHPLKVAGFNFYIRDWMDIWTLKEVLIDDVYQVKQTLANHKKAITVIDIGASIADFDIFCDRLISKGQVIAYEPDKNRIALAKKNLALNKAQKVVLVTKFATSLDKLFKTHHLKNCDLLKIDCEGGEYPVLLSSPASLAKVANLAMEVHLFDSTMQSNFLKLKKLLKKLGFKVEIIENPVHQNICYLFAKKN